MVEVVEVAHTNFLFNEELEELEELEVKAGKTGRFSLVEVWFEVGIKLIKFLFKIKLRSIIIKIYIVIVSKKKIFHLF